MVKPDRNTQQKCVPGGGPAGRRGWCFPVLLILVLRNTRRVTKAIGSSMPRIELVTYPVCFTFIIEF